jgi:RPA family protein
VVPADISGQRNGAEPTSNVNYTVTQMGQEQTFGRSGRVAGNMKRGRMRRMTDKENAQWILKAAKDALRHCEEQEREWKQKQEEAYQSLIEAAKQAENHRLNKIKMEREVEQLEYELRELEYKEADSVD